jgi:hypothetical protein
MRSLLLVESFDLRPSNQYILVFPFCGNVFVAGKSPVKVYPQILDILGHEAGRMRCTVFYLQFLESRRTLRDFISQNLWFPQQDRHTMMRRFVILAAIVVFGHLVSSRPQGIPFDVQSLLGGGNNNFSPFGFNPGNLLKPDAIQGVIPAPGGQAQATVAPAEPGAAKKKRSSFVLPFQELIPTGIPSNWIPGADAATPAKPSGN